MPGHSSLPAEDAGLIAESAGTGQDGNHHTAEKLKRYYSRPCTDFKSGNVFFGGIGQHIRTAVFSPPAEGKKLLGFRSAADGPFRCSEKKGRTQTGGWQTFWQSEKKGSSMVSDTEKGRKVG